MAPPPYQFTNHLCSAHTDILYTYRKICVQLRIFLYYYLPVSTFRLTNVKLNIDMRTYFTTRTQGIHYPKAHFYQVLTFPSLTMGLSYFRPPTSPTGHTDTRCVYRICKNKSNIKSKLQRLLLYNSILQFNLEHLQFIFC